MIVTILFYSLFTCVTAFATAPWQMVALRFLVAMGVGGEWAVASAMVAEVMPLRSRPVMSSIFHGSSVLGTILAAGAGSFIVGNESLGEDAWRWAFAIGALPALLTLWIRWKLREPDQWVKARELATADATQQPGRISELFAGTSLRNTIVGVSLASIGLVTFWGIHIYGKDALLRHEQQMVLAEAGVPADASNPIKQAAFADHKGRIKDAEMLSMVLNSLGGGLGLVLFGTISNRMGRKGAFILYHAAAFAMVLVLFVGLIPNQASPFWLGVTLPVFGFFTLGMHAGYAVYFPELYPTRLRGTGAGFCFNVGRLATAAAFFLFAAFPGVTDTNKALILAPLYLLGVVVVLFARETRGEELPE
jgi:MFS family permease